MGKRISTKPREARISLSGQVGRTLHRGRAQGVDYSSPESTRNTNRGPTTKDGVVFEKKKKKKSKENHLTKSAT